MERRWKERVPVETEVTVSYPPLGTWPGRTRNISLGGMLLDVGEGRHIPENANIDIYLPGKASQSQPLHIPAVVVRHEDGHIGTSFRNLGLATFQALTRLYQPQPA